MPKFIIRRYVDAYSVQETEVEAETAKEAAIKAANGEEELDWSDEEIVTFDNRRFVAANVFGDEISGSEVER
jgi:hypothetical protein